MQARKIRRTSLLNCISQPEHPIGLTDMVFVKFKTVKLHINKAHGLIKYALFMSRCQ